MEGVSCRGLERSLPSLEMKRVQSMSEQENNPPPDSLHSLVPNHSTAAQMSNSQQERQASSTFPQEQQACSTSSRVQPPRCPLQSLTISLPGVDASSSGQHPYPGGDEAEEKQIPASVFQFPPPLHHNPLFHHAPRQNPPFHQAPHQHQPLLKKESPVTCVVEQEGHLCLQLRYEREVFLEKNLLFRCAGYKGFMRVLCCS